MRLRQQAAALDNVIRTDRFDGQRNRIAQHVRDYDEGMRELNARYPEQLDVTRGPDAVGEDVRFIFAGIIAGLLVGVLACIVKFRAWEYFGGTW